MAILHVDKKTGNDQTGVGSTNKPWLTVSHAVAQAAAGSIIEIGDGKYTEALVINKDLTLRGKSLDKTVIVCPDNLPDTLGAVQFESPLPPGPQNVPDEHLTTLPMIHVVGKVKVRFENLEFLGDKSFATQHHAIGLCASAKDVELEVETCRILGFQFCHIIVMDGRLVVSNSRVGTSPFTIGSDLGIMLGNKSTATITNTEIGNRTDHCIDLYQDSFAEITHCTLLGGVTPNTNGVRLSGNARANIFHNTILGQDTKNIPSNTSQAGIQIGKQSFDTANADIHHNLIKGFSNGLYANCNTASRVWGNTITNNFYCGVSVFSANGGVLDLGGGPQGSPGENLIQNNGELSGIEMELTGDFTCFARFNDWGTTDLGKVLDRVKLTKFLVEKPLPILDLLPFKQIPAPQPIDSVLLLDQSGSMLEEGKWQSALAAADVLAFGSSFINFDLAQIQLALITFAGTDAGHTSVWQELSALPLVASPISSLLTTAPDPSWTTPMGSGLKKAQEILDASSSTERRRYIFLLSDGKANTGPSPEDVYPGFGHGINVYSIGFGDDSIDPETLSKISNATLGDYVLTKTTDNLDLKRFFLNSLAYPLNLQIILNTREQGVTTFPVNSGEDKMLVLIGWEDTSLQIDFDLERPDGTLIKPDSPPSGSVFRAEAGASFASYTILNPIAGDWKFANIRQQSGGPAPDVCRFVAVDPVVIAQFWLDRGATVMGQSLRLNARLLENGAAIDNADITVEVTGPRFSLGTLVVDHLASQNDLLDQIRRRLTAARPLQRSDILHDYRRRRSDKLLPTTSASARLLGLKHPSGAGTASGIFQTEFEATREGTYSFEFVAQGETPSGATFRRTYTVSKYVSFAADPILTLIAVTPDVTIDPRRAVKPYKVDFTPIAGNGDRMGPFGSARIKIHNDGRSLDVDITDNMDGSYLGRFSLNPGETFAKLRLSIDGVEIPLVQSQPTGCLAFWRHWFG